jgi:hypothetical protein
MQWLLATGVALWTAVVLTGGAGAAGGNYVFAGGSDAAQAAAPSALDCAAPRPGLARRL